MLRLDHRDIDLNRYDSLHESECAWGCECEGALSKLRNEAVVLAGRDSVLVSGIACVHCLSPCVACDRYVSQFAIATCTEHRFVPAKHCCPAVLSQYDACETVPDVAQSALNTRQKYKYNPSHPRFAHRPSSSNTNNTITTTQAHSASFIVTISAQPTTLTTNASFMHTSPTFTNEPSNLTKMLAFFRKSKSTSVMANANTSETTLVSTAHVASGKPKRKTPRETVPYQAEFSGMGMMGGMPAMGGHMFLEPPSPTESAASKKSVKMVPEQPFKSSPKASFASARVETAKGRESFDTMATTAATTASGSTSPQRRLLKQHKAFFNNSFSNT